MSDNRSVLDLSTPPVFLGYQSRSLKATATYAVCFIEKSRRIGLTWGISADAVLHAAAQKKAGGMDVFYIGFNLDMTREFIDTCATWAKHFNHAADAVDEFLFQDGKDEDGADRFIQAFRIRFASGFDIVALTSRPRSLRGRQGYVIIDEAAFHDDLPELMKAALALLIWGGKVAVISTHDGVDNPFNQYVQQIRAGKLKYGLLRIDLDDALRDGLYKRICLTRGLEWSAEAEAAWRQDVIDFYGDGADEELFCQPRNGGGKYLSGALVEARMYDAPVLRLAYKDEFVHQSQWYREKTVHEWCEENLKPLLEALSLAHRHYLGEDFGRSGDLTSLFPMAVLENLVRKVPFIVELHNVPFAQQKQIVWYILDRLPRLCGAAFDARGNGSQLAEETMQHYGSGIIHPVMPSPKWYLEAFPPYKAAFEDGSIMLPKDADVLNDHRVAEVVRGVPVIPDKRTKGADGKQRHGDALVAGAMAYWATLQATVEYDYTAMPRPAINSDGRMRMRAEDLEQDDMKPFAGSHGFMRGKTW